MAVYCLNCSHMVPGIAWKCEVNEATSCRERPEGAFCLNCRRFDAGGHPICPFCDFERNARIERKERKLVHLKEEYGKK